MTSGFFSRKEKQIFVSRKKRMYALATFLSRIYICYPKIIICGQEKNVYKFIFIRLIDDSHLLSCIHAILLCTVPLIKTNTDRKQC